MEVRHFLKFGNMSRIGKEKIEIPQGVEVKIENNLVSVKGPKGNLERQFLDIVIISKDEDGKIKVEPKNDEVFTRSIWGTTNSHIKNMVKGVTESFVKKLIVEGVGFKAEVKGKNLDLSLGFSHPISMEIPEGIDVVSEKNIVTISGIDKEKVGLFASKVRIKKKPEPYKGKGIRYEDEIIIRKEGKKAA